MRNLPEKKKLWEDFIHSNLSQLHAIAPVDILRVGRRGHRVFGVRVPEVAVVALEHVEVTDMDAKVAERLASCQLDLCIRYVGEVNLFIHPRWPGGSCDWCLLEVNRVHYSRDCIWGRKFNIKLACHLQFCSSQYTPGSNHTSLICSGTVILFMFVAMFPM